MAAMKKKKVSKDDLRRLMKESRSTGSLQTKKIDSPLAKYNNLGQLFCVLCNSQVKSEKLWNAHIQGRTHKENVALLKQRSQSPATSVPSTAKRKGDLSSADIPEKRTKVNVPISPQNKGLPSGFFDNGSKPNMPKPVTSLGIAQYSDSDDEDGDDPTHAKSAPATSTSSAGLPADFFDTGIKASEPAPETPKTPTSAKVMSDAIPEGFFDDPKMDAKVRQVEYKDKMDEQWELFQRAMKDEAVVSEAIIQEEDENVTAERNIDEIDEQLHRWSRVDSLAKQKEELMTQTKNDKQLESDDSDIDEKEFEEFLDWRSKNAWT